MCNPNHPSQNKPTPAGKKEFHLQDPCLDPEFHAPACAHPLPASAMRENSVQDRLSTTSPSATSRHTPVQTPPQAKRLTNVHTVQILSKSPPRKHGQTERSASQAAHQRKGACGRLHCERAPPFSFLHAVSPRQPLPSSGTSRSGGKNSASMKEIHRKIPRAQSGAALSCPPNCTPIPPPPTSRMTRDPALSLTSCAQLQTCISTHDRKRRRKGRRQRRRSVEGVDLPRRGEGRTLLLVPKIKSRRRRGRQAVC